MTKINTDQSVRKEVDDIGDFFKPKYQISEIMQLYDLTANGTKKSVIKIL